MQINFVTVNNIGTSFSWLWFSTFFRYWHPVTTRKVLPHPVEPNQSINQSLILFLPVKQKTEEKKSQANRNQYFTWREDTE